MEKLIDSAADRVKAMADRLESTLKGLAYKARAAFKDVATVVKGVLPDQR